MFPNHSNHRHNQTDESTDFDKYLAGSDDDQKYEQRPKYLYSEELNMQVHSINKRLEGMGIEKLGDLTSTGRSDVEKTIQVIETLISEVKKYMDVKMRITNEKRQVEQNIQQLEVVVERLAKDKKGFEGDKENLLQRVKLMEKSARDTNSLVEKEKEELNKQIKQLQTREKTFEAEFRKKENTIKSLQDNIRKFQDKPTFKNSFDIIQKLELGPNIYDMCSTNGENEYGRLAREARDDTCRKLSEENLYLKETLANIYKELHCVLELKKETLRNKKGYDGEYDDKFELNAFRPETLYLPEQWSSEKLRELTENIHKFKEAIKIGDHAENRIDERKEGCVNGIKQLIKSYRNAIDTQDQLINKVILKSKDFKMNEMNQLENKFSKITDNGEIDRAKRFVEEHSQYLQSKNAEIEKTRKLMQNAFKKAEESKKEMLRQKQVFEEEALDIRRSVEVLPAMIEEELGKSSH